MKRDCPICGSDNDLKIPFTISEKISDALKEKKIIDKIDWYLCKTCGNGYQNILPDIRLLKKEWEEKDTVSEASEKYSAKAAKRVFDYFYPKIQNRKSILDVACGHGYLINQFKQKGCKVLGSDIDPKTKKIHERLRVPSIIGDAASISLDEKYEVIFCNNAIYFITDTVNFLTKIKEHLTDNGLLCISMADFLSSQDKALPSYGLSFYPNFYSIRSLLDIAGYQIISIEKKLTNILIMAKPSSNSTFEFSYIDFLKVYLLIKTKKLRYYLWDLPLIYLHRIASGSRLALWIKKLIKY